MPLSERLSKLISSQDFYSEPWLNSVVTNQDLAGQGLDDFFPLPKDFNPRIKGMLKAYRDHRVLYIEVKRSPIPRRLISSLPRSYREAIKESLKKHGKEDEGFVHLSLTLILIGPEGQRSTVKLEKRNHIYMEVDEGWKQIENDPEEGTMVLTVNPPISLYKFVYRAAKYVGKSLFVYDFFTTNCQKFVYDVLCVNDLIKCRLNSIAMEHIDNQIDYEIYLIDNPHISFSRFLTLEREKPQLLRNLKKHEHNSDEITKFVYQDVSSILNGVFSPSWEKLIKSITDISSRFQRWVGGEIEDELYF